MIILGRDFSLIYGVAPIATAQRARGLAVLDAALPKPSHRRVLPTLYSYGLSGYALSGYSLYSYGLYCYGLHRYGLAILEAALPKPCPSPGPPNTSS